MFEVLILKKRVCSSVLYSRLVVYTIKNSLSSYVTDDQVGAREHSSILFETCVAVYGCKICE